MDGLLRFARNDGLSRALIERLLQRDIALLLLAPVAAGARRPAVTIFAPSATKISAVCKPMPLVAPVITATLPFSRPIWLTPFDASLIPS